MEKLMLSLYMVQLTVADKLRNRRRESGQGSLEYVGMIAVAALIIALVVAAVSGPTLKTWIDGVITGITTSTNVPPK
ncbi:hypothetical protein [Microlunatus speluncae]|uniref:hypothetical protein n=1 Tax=Microlunatus speluncae TaxID=2594267 RepID=UPI001375F24C|nr:hypothetical protein [Microlunatus speluncae]